MALPVITNAADCADFSKTVLPYLHQTYLSLTNNPPSASILTDPEALRHIYTTTNPVASALVFSVATFPIFLIVSEINKNYSQVDRVWSILPALYNVHYAVWAHLNGLPTQRIDNILAFSLLWSCRLTYNYWRKGGYKVGSEDYRWALIKDYIGQPAFFLLNLVFISSFQILILFAVTTPSYLLLLTSLVPGKANYKPAEVFLTATTAPVSTFFPRALLALIILSYFADQQQWTFHAAKATFAKTAKVPTGWTRAQIERGFNTTGLWAWSRHPNFAAEQSIWVTLYAWAAYETGVYLNWTAVGAIFYVLVFVGSTPITEWISAGKYPEYALYRMRVAKFIPRLFGGAKWNEEEMVKRAPEMLQQVKKRDQGKSTVAKKAEFVFK